MFGGQCFGIFLDVLDIIESLALSQNRQLIKIDHSTLEVVFTVYYFYTAVLYFPRCNK